MKFSSEVSKSTMDPLALFDRFCTINSSSKKRTLDEELISKLDAFHISKRGKRICNNSPSQISANQSSCLIKHEQRDWSSLTDDMLRFLLNLLDSMPDFASFRQVCKSWFDISTPSNFAFASQPPLVLCTRLPDFSKGIFDIARQRFCRNLSYTNLHKTPSTLSYSHGFLISKLGLDSGFLLKNIFTGVQFNLPNAFQPFKQVRLSSSPTDLDCMVVLFRPNESSLQYCNIGDSEWHIIEKCNAGEVFDDMLFFEGKLYALMDTKNLALIDLDSLKIKFLGEDEELYKSQNGDTNNRWMLAKCNGYLLRVMINLLQGLSAFKWDFKYDKWVEVLSLDGKSLFFSSGGFGGFISPNCKGIRANCVYYIGHRNDIYYELSFSGRKIIHLCSNGSQSLAKGLSISNPPVWILPSLC